MKTSLLVIKLHMQQFLSKDVYYFRDL